MSPDMCTIYSNTNIKRVSMGGNFSFILIEFNPLLINIQINNRTTGRTT